MSESVWFEQVDKSLIAFVQSVVPSPKDGLILPVTIRKPDEDFKVETYPSATLYNLYSRPDEFRHFMDVVTVGRDFETKRILQEEAATPYNLFYQLDFWATLQQHMNAMTMNWLGKLSKRWFNLDVLDISGKPRNLFCLQQGQLQKSDILDGSSRVYHSILTYRIYTELDENIQIDEPMVTEEEFVTRQKQ